MITNKLLIASAFTFVFVSCKKTEIEKLTIGEKKKMIVTEVNTTIKTAYTVDPLEDPIVLLDLDQDGINDAEFRLGVYGEQWVGNTGDELPWDFNFELLHPNFFTNNFPEYVVHRTYSQTIGDSIGGLPSKTVGHTYSCEEKEGSAPEFRSQVRTFKQGDKFVPITSSYSMFFVHNFLVAQSLEEFVVKRGDEKEIDGEILINETVIERHCNEIDYSSPLYIPFKKLLGDANDPKYQLGWIELEVSTENKSITIKRHAISKSVLID